MKPKKVFKGAEYLAHRRDLLLMKERNTTSREMLTVTIIKTVITFVSAVMTVVSACSCRCGSSRIICNHAQPISAHTIHGTKHQKRHILSSHNLALQ